MFIRTEAFSQGSTLSTFFGWWEEVEYSFYFFCKRRGKERAGGPWHKAFEGRWQQECEFYSQDLCIGMLSLRSAQESSLFFPLIISYCQLRLVLAAYSLLIVNSVGPHSKFTIQHKSRGHGRSTCFVQSALVPVCKRKLQLFYILQYITIHNTTQQ